MSAAAMTEAQLTALLDAHDALVSACVEGRLTFTDFAGAYGGFPRSYALDGEHESPEFKAILRRSRRRIAFHQQVAALLSALEQDDGSSMGLPAETGGFLPQALFHRLRLLLSRHPDFQAESPVTHSN